MQTHIKVRIRVWDPSSKQLEQQIEAVQRKAVRFIKNPKGRRDSVTENLKLLNMKLIYEGNQTGT